MEHITIKQMGNGFVQLTPNKGYMLYNSRTRQVYSKAVVREHEIKWFKAVEE